MAAPLDAWVDLFIDKSFRDAADEDYIAARAAYRLGLNQPFLWSSLQAVEKYIKAILLYSRHSTLKIGHDVVKGFALIDRITDIPFTFPPDIRLFLEYINGEGPNRYRGYPAQLRDDALIGLDRTVWHLRRYCYNLRGIPANPAKLANELLALQQDPLEYATKFRIPGGLLELVLEEKSEKRRSLIWKNFWYGSRRRRSIKSYPRRWQWSQPVHFMQPHVYDAIKDLVQFEPGVRQHFAALTRTNKKEE